MDSEITLPEVRCHHCHSLAMTLGKLFNISPSHLFICEVRVIPLAHRVVVKIAQANYC